MSDFDYVLEEKREQSYDVGRLLKEADDNEKGDEKLLNGVLSKHDDDSDGELNDDDDEEKKKQKDEETKLELMQHAKDYTLYVEQHTQKLDDVPQGIHDLPDTISSAEIETK